jgi:hypothetical protein
VQPVAPPSGGSYDVGGYPTYYHSSTAAEGQLRGMGDVIRSQGQANLNNSAAAINYSVARSSEIDNANKWTSTYFNMRETNRRAREAERRPRASMEDLVRYAQAGKPQSLSPSELDPVSGKISWPAFLATDHYASHRGALESVFARRATTGAIDAAEYMEVRKTTDAMMDELKSQIREIPPAQYTFAKRFIQSLAYEASQPAA